ncbi:MAG: DUF2191 domain-containing protein [Bacillota bacterium]|nr:DUF2191 domain-containing protein [Bacillota bacterium]
MRTTLNISENIIREVERLYKTGSRSKSVENALEDAVRLKKIKDFMALKGKLDIDEESIKALREAELRENEDHS